MKDIFIGGIVTCRDGQIHSTIFSVLQNRLYATVNDLDPVVLYDDIRNAMQSVGIYDALHAAGMTEPIIHNLRYALDHNLDKPLEGIMDSLIRDHRRSSCIHGSVCQTSDCEDCEDYEMG